jgi:TIGR02453 family protein
MSTELFRFLTELKKNNNRPWFKEHKKQYDQLLAWFTAEIQELIERIGTFDPEIVGLEAKSCIYRIYRDIRFSNDKTPYKTHFGAYMAGFGGRTGSYAGYYVHLEPGNSLLSGGAWQPPPPLLKKLRRDIYNNMDEFRNITENKEFKETFPELEGEMQKRILGDFPADYPFIDILKHRDFVVTSIKQDLFFNTSNWKDQAIDDFKKLYPFNRFLNYTIKDFLDKA